jgi:hypothetical protein
MSHFSDAEIGQIREAVQEELDRRGEWNVLRVTRRSEEPSIVDVTMRRVHDEGTTLLVALPYGEYSDTEFENESQWSKAVFNVAIRFLEFDDTRGFEGFPNGATIALKI